MKRTGKGMTDTRGAVQRQSTYKRDDIKTKKCCTLKVLYFNVIATYSEILQSNF